MKTVFQASDGTIFETSIACLEYERTHSALIMYGVNGVTDRPEEAFVVILKSHYGAKKFISLCKNGNSKRKGINEYSKGIFIWNRGEFIEIHESIFSALRHFFRDID